MSMVRINSRYGNKKNKKKGNGRIREKRSSALTYDENEAVRENGELAREETDQTTRVRGKKNNSATLSKPKTRRSKPCKVSI